MKQARRLALAWVALAGLISCPAAAQETYWQHEPAAVGDWFDPANWTNGVPDAAMTACVDNGGTAKIFGGQNETGVLEIDLGAVVQIGGTHTIRQDLRLGVNAPDSGTYTLDLGALYALDGEVVGLFGSGSFVHNDGQHQVPGELILGSNAGSTGSYVISGGLFVPYSLIVGGDGRGTLEIAHPDAEIAVNNGILRFGPDSGFTAVAGSTIFLLGGSIDNESTDPAELSGLGELTAIFQIGQWMGSLELAGQDRGPDLSGWEGNFALNTLQLGDPCCGGVGLVDGFDNQLDGQLGNEALYVRNLTLNPGSALHLNGLKLYFLVGGVPKQLRPGDANLDGAVEGADYTLWADYYQTGWTGWPEGDFNGDRLTEGGDYTLWADNYQAGGSPVPEPGAAALLALGACGLLRRRR